MAEFTWVFDAPTGTYKNRKLSEREYVQAVEDTVFMPYVQAHPALGRKMGETVTLLRVANIAEPDSLLLNEGQRVPEDAFSISTTSITVQEIGRSVPYTSLSNDLGAIDVPDAIRRELRKQLKLGLDTMVATELKTCQVKYIPTSISAGTFDTDGTASSTAGAAWNIYHAEEVRDYMYDTLRCPPYSGDDYVGIFRTKSIRGLKRDPEWEEWHKYTDPQAKFNSEVGRIERIRHIETNHANALGNSGTGDVLGEGLVFGEDAIAMAEVMTPEMRMGLPMDLGRQRLLGWYGILNFGLIWDTANAGEARIIHVTSDS